MRTPKWVPVLNYPYHIKYFETPQDLDGACCPKSRLIYLDKRIKDQLLDETLLHEIIHAWQFESGISEVTSEEILEVSCAQLSKFLLSIFSIEFKEGVGE